MASLNHDSRAINEPTDKVGDYNNLHSKFAQTDLFQACLRQVLGDDFIPTAGQYSFVGRKALNWVTEKLLQKGDIYYAAEIGCGSGEFAPYLVKALRCSLLATDFSPVAIEKARHNNMHPEITYEVADFFNLPVTDNSLDALVGFDCVNHASSYDQLCRELSRVMKPGGRVAFTNWMKNYPLTQLINSDPLCECLSRYGFTVDNILSIDSHLTKQFQFYGLVYQNQRLIKETLGANIYDSLMSEATHLYQFRGSVSHFAFTATLNDK